MELHNKSDPHIGLQLRNQSVDKDANFNKGLTVCGRFYFLRFPQFLLRIGTEEDPFVRFYAKYDQSYFELAKRWFVVQDIQENSYHIWKTNIWNHICLSFERTTMRINFVKVIDFSSSFFCKKYSIHFISYSLSK